MTYIPQPTHRAEFGWSPKAYVSIMRVDMGQAAEELSKYSHDVPREDQVYQLQEVIKFASKVVDNAQLALRMLNDHDSPEWERKKRAMAELSNETNGPRLTE